MKRFFIFSVFVAFLLLIPVSFKQLTCGFKLAKMRLEAPFRVDWEVSPSLTKKELQSILSQPYSYLDRGAQCYVFASKDQQYVVKLFRYDGSLFSKKKVSQGKIEHLFSACTLAYKKAREETGLLFLHLNITDGELPELHARGPIGQSLSIPLDKYRFAIQKKVRLLEDSLLEAYRSSDQEAMKRRIDSLLLLLHSRAASGIRNKDPSLSRNFGFLGERAFEIDFGNYSQSIAFEELEVARYAQRLRSWLLENAPEFVSYLDERTMKNGR